MGRTLKLLSLHPLLLVLGLSAALPLLLFAGVAWTERTRTLQEAERAAVRTVWALHEHAAKVLETHELLLAEVARQVGGRTWDEVEADRSLRGYLLRVTADLDQVTDILLADETGRVRLSTATDPLPTGATVADRGFFAFHRDGGSGTYIGPARSGPDGHRTITVSHRVQLASEDGAGAGGVVAITVRTDHFTAFWRRFAPSVAHVIPLVRSDGQVIERHPTATATAAPERLSVRGPFLSRALTQREGVYTAVSQVDGIERINAFTRVKDYPLHLSFSVETRAVLAEWRERMAMLGLFSALAAVALLVATGFAIRQQRQQAAASLRWKETADRLAAEMAAREQAEASLRRAQTLNAVGQLTAGVAHDFNNLLQAIRGGFTLLRKPRTPEAAEALIASSLQAVDRGAKLVRQLMVFARREKLEPQPVDLRALLGGMGELLQKAAGSGVRIEAELDPGLHPVMVDPTQTELAILNLVVNARDAMEGEGTITITARNIAVLKAGTTDTAVPPGDYVVLAVRDTGCGMTREVLDRAMEPFFTTKPLGKGTGLGLSMVHGFVSQSGGDMRIQSEPGRGATVSLYLPRAAAGAQPRTTRGPVEEMAAAAAGEAATVLLVDDDALARLVTAAGLREVGHRVLEARDAGEALEALSANPGVDMLVTDYAMPGMNGAKLAEAARVGRPDLPVLVITGYAAEMAEDLERVADAVLRKPFGMEDLDARIRAAICARAALSGTPGRSRATQERIVMQQPELPYSAVKKRCAG